MTFLLWLGDLFAVTCELDGSINALNSETVYLEFWADRHVKTRKAVAKALRKTRDLMAKAKRQAGPPRRVK